MGNVMQIETSVKYSDFSVWNSDFTRARCRVMYTGRNRNHTDITEDALNKLISRKGYANIPVVAHLYKGDDGKWRVGGHDSKILLNSGGGIEVVNETIPFGVIPENCNPSFEDVTEASGEVKRYFCVDVILWTHRYNIMDAAKSDELYFNQSMEITINHCDYDRDDYCVIDDFNLSALCLLNHDPYDKRNEVEPCFPSAGVRKFELGDLQNDIETMLCKLKEFENKKGEKDLDITQVKSKLNGDYFALSCTPDAVFAMNKAFELYEIPYKTDAESKEIVFDYKKAGKKYISAADSGMSSEPIAEYVETLKSDVAAGAEKMYSEKIEAEKMTAIKDLTDKFNEISAKYAALQGEYEAALKKIEAYDNAEKQAAADKHKAEIDGIIGKYADRLSGNPDYLYYTTKVDYSKTAEQVEEDMFIIIGKQASRGNGKAEFSANWSARTVAYGNGKDDDSSVSRRYGNLFDKYE